MNVIELVPFLFPMELFLGRRHLKALSVTHCITCLHLQFDAVDLHRVYSLVIILHLKKYSVLCSEIN